MTAILLAVLALQPGTSGDLLFRVLNRFPACEGVLSGAYAGNGVSFLHRARYGSGPFQAVMLMEKDRGEDWGDLVAAGAGYSSDGGSIRSAAGGWLRASLGSGMVFSHPSGWGEGGPGLDAKPPQFRMLVAPAASAGACDGRPLTGAAATGVTGGVGFAALAAYSEIDPSGDGLHRTASQIEARGSVVEKAAAARVEAGPAGATFACRRAGGDDRIRAGADFRLQAGPVLLSGEAAVESDSARTVAWWTSVSESSEPFRFNGMFFSCPAGYGDDDRCEFPADSPCDAGCGAAFRWRPAAGWISALSLTASTLEGEGSQRGSFYVSWRTGPTLELTTSCRAASIRGAESWRWTVGSTMEALRNARIDAEVQLTGAADEETLSGGAVEARLRWDLLRSLSVSVGAAGFSTQGYAARAYVGELGFPGEFASTSVWGDGFLLQAAAAVDLPGGGGLKIRASRMVREGEQSLGSGLEETDGPGRTEIGAQWEMPF